jgi:hypothetical protein
MKFNLLASASTLAMGSLVALALPQHAQAGLICSGQSCSETVSAAATKTDFSNVGVMLDMFNPSGTQTLTSVVISDSANFTAVGGLTNTSTSSQTFKFQAGLGLSLLGGTGAPADFPLVFASGSINPHTYTLAGGGYTPYNFNDVFSSSTETLTGVSNLTGFIGSSTFQALFEADATTSFTGGGNNIQTNLTTTATPSVTITYNFTGSATPPGPQAAPEPASMAVLGSGLIGMGVMRRRRNKA